MGQKWAKYKAEPALTLVTIDDMSAVGWVRYVAELDLSDESNRNNALELAKSICATQASEITLVRFLEQTQGNSSKKLNERWGDWILIFEEVFNEE